MKSLEYPFDAEEILKKKKSIKKQLLADDAITFIEKKIAILGGETTQNIKLMLELFLLNNGIKPVFYESEYNQYYEDGMFPNQELESFAPDLIYICTCIRNIVDFPLVSDTKEIVESKRQALVDKFFGLWDAIRDRYHCPIIQNNFEYPFFRLMGNKDASDFHGRVNYVTTLNCAFYEYAQSHDDFFICDVNYISASYGLDKWSDPFYWHMYKYAVAVPAIPYLSFNVANIIKSIYGRNKKAFNLDLDNTLWGGIVGDDGVENIEIGQETSMAQTYSEFQDYLKLHKQIGVLLTVNSKNDEKNALSGFERPDSVLKRDDFVSFKANWNPKSINLTETAKELTLLPESFVFVDDNPAERAIIEGDVAGVAIPEIKEVEHYIQMIDKSGFFEVTNLSSDDLKRNDMYQENAKRQQLQSSFTDYTDYLKSLEMKGEIREFVPMYMSRIAQLTNKSNQFNLTTKRYSQSDIEKVAENSNYITLYGKLSDRFGDNGVVSLIIGRIEGQHRDELHLELWLMSCRVLKRDMEYAMMDELVNKAKQSGIKRLVGYYYPTAKNAMVKDFYALQGFTKVSEDSDGNTIWKYDITDSYEVKQQVIDIN
ncbi:HAD-superfamily phosphatase, subfamily IIIC/FkbH-like domain-containing protein [Lachnospiraceae bacterium NE2001]|nr:HAD-superfamily phosphatase, subfamily IIIC/FkbH-like domain-containing protein [Lachnospiraceae bacterium NE2001]